MPLIIYHKRPAHLIPTILVRNCQFLTQKFKLNNMKNAREIIAIAILFAIGYLTYKLFNSDKRLNPVPVQVKQCRCPSLFTQQVWFEKHQMFMDSMEHANKANRERLTDSVSKYNELLRRNEL